MGQRFLSSPVEEAHQEEMGRFGVRASTRKEKLITLLTAGDRPVASAPEGSGASSELAGAVRLAGSTRTSVAVFATASEITAAPVEWLWPGKIPMGSITVVQA